MKTSKTISLTCALLMALMIHSPLLMFSQAVNPKGYWRFELPDTTLNTANAAFPISHQTNKLNPSNLNPIAGHYNQMVAWPMLVPFTDRLDSGWRTDMLSYECWLRFRPGHRVGTLQWSGKGEFTFVDNGIVWSIYTTGTSNTQTQAVFFSGTGATDPQSIYDGGWHHFAFTLDLCLNQQKIYVDGVCPQGFTRIIPAGAGSIAADGGLFIGTPHPPDRIQADIDELAVYDTVLSPEMVYQHYLDVLGGNPYNNTQIFTGPIPMPSNTSPYGYDPMEFAAGYPNIPERPLQLFNKYPLPRYPVNDSMHRNLPWNADPNPFTSFPATSTYTQEARVIHEQLALDWNYMLFGGIVQTLVSQMDTLTYHVIPNTYAFQIRKSFKDPDLSGLPRFMASNWRFVNPSWANPAYAGATGPYIRAGNNMNSFYVSNSLGNPILYPFFGGSAVLYPSYAMANPNLVNDPRIALVRRDGEYVKVAIERFLDSVPAALRYVDMLGENDEMLHGIVDSVVLASDPDIQADKLASSLSWIPYQGRRIHGWRSAYRDSVRIYLNNLLAAASRPPLQDIWYNTAGQKTPYPQTRDILTFRDGIKRPCMDIYPLEPGRWRHGVNELAGFDNVVKAVHGQLPLGDRLFIPAVAPGINEGNPGALFFTTDIAMLRPGQYLGLLKGLGALGAEAYNSYTYWHPVNTDPSNWRPWFMPMAGYAQAAMTRAKPFLYNGTVLMGDTGMTYIGGMVPNSYTFSTGNVNDLVVCRQLSGQNQFLITASAQRLTNAPGVTPRVKDITFRLRDTAGTVIFQQLQIEERLQGSTYILNLNTPSSPVFIQLDRWHEWKEPSRWCRDFDFEAEVWDSVTASPVTATERPAGFAAGDFREFTTFVNMPSPSDILGYRFRPRGADQSTLYFHARVRNRAVDSLSLTASVDGVSVPLIKAPPGSGWQWVSSPIPFTPLDTTWHWLTVLPGSDSLDFDLVTLKRSDAAFSTQPFTASIAANTVCLGDTTRFSANLTLPAGCIDFHWDFGDGRSAYEMEPSHLYQYPGNYQVVFTAWHACLDTYVTDTLQVLVVAPMVDAGPPVMVCPDTSGVLAGSVQPGTTFFWLPNPALSSTTVLDPVVQGSGSQYFYLQGTLNGCSMTDSVWVVLADTLQPQPMPDDTVCRGTMLPLWVNNVHAVWWDSVPGIVYGQGCSPCFTGTATQVLTWHATDACHCDTVSGQVTVTVDTMQAYFALVTSASTLCLGDSIRLQATGGLTYVWSGGLDSIANPWAQPTSTTTYSVSISGLACNLTDTVTVTVVAPGLAIRVDTLCLGDTLTLYAFGDPNSHYLWSPTGDSTQSILVTGLSTMDYVVQIDSAFGCHNISDTITVLVDSSLLNMTLPTQPDTLCLGDSLRLFATGGLTYAWSGGLDSVANPWAYPTSTTTYSVTISGMACVMTDSVEITVDTSYQALLTPPDTLCLGDSLQLLATGGLTYAWSGGLDSVANPWAHPTATTTYSVTISGMACVMTDSVEVVVDTSLTYMSLLTPPDTLCLGDSLQLVATGGLTYAWSGGLDSVANPWAHPTSTTTYSVTVSGMACVMTDSVTITVDTSYQALLTPPDTLCLGDSLQLLATGGLTYAWSGGLDSVANPWAYPTSTTTYSVTISGMACVMTDSVQVVVDTSLTYMSLLTPPDTLCLGDSLQFLATGGLTYVWSGGLDSVANPWAHPTATTTYSVTISGTTCVMTDSVTITVDTSYQALLTPPDTVCLGDSLQLLATGGLTYAWSGGLDSVANPWAYPASTTTYSVTISGMACVMTDSVEIVVDTVPAGMLTADTNRVCRGDTVFLTASGGTSYLWNDGSTLPVRAEIPLSTGWWAVTVSDGGFCTWADSVLVTVDTNCCFIPGAVVLQDTVLASAAGLANLTGGDYHVLDMLVVDVAANFSGVTFHMAPGAVIDVLPGVWVNSVGCTYTAACGDSLWGHVRLAGAGTTWIANGDLYEHAREAILVEAGAKIKSTGSVYRLCGRGIRVRPVANTQSPVTLKNNRFLGGPMLPPLQYATLGFAGVQADSVDVLDLEGRNFFSGWQSGALVSACGEASSSNNTFSNCRAGINVQNTTRMLVGSPGAGRSNTFTSCVDGVVTKGSATWVVDNRFDRCTVGLRGLGPGANAATTVSGSLHALGTALADSANIYLDCWRGVSTDGKQRVVVRGDSILRSENAGIHTRFNDGGSFTVERNVLVDNTVGVFAGTSSGMAGMVKWNVVRGDQAAMRTGIQAGNLVYPALPVTSNYRFLIHDNDIRLRGNGIWVERCDWVDVWLNRVEARPGPPTLPVPLHGGINMLAGNNVRISENTVESDGIGQGSLQTRGVYVFASSKVDVRCNTVRRAGRSFVWQGDCRPANFLGNSMQQGIEGLVMLGTSPSTPGGAPLAAIIGKQGTWTALGDLADAPSDNRWIGGGWANHTMSIFTNSTSLNQMIVRQQGNWIPSLNGFTMGYSPIVPFQLPLGNFLMVTCGQGAGGNDNAKVIKDKLQNLPNSNDPVIIGAKWRIEKQAYLDLKDDPAIAAQDTFLNNWFTSLSGTELAYSGDAQGAIDIRDTTQAAAYTSALLGIIWPSSLDKAVSEIQLNGALDDSLNLVVLRQVAAECMVAGGPSVNLARALLATTGEWVYVDPSCVSNSRSASAVKSEGEGKVHARCWPNPTSGLLNYDIPCFDAGEDEIAVSITDMAGRSVMKAVVPCGAGFFEIPELANGVHLVEFQGVSGNAWRWIVMIAK